MKTWPRELLCVCLPAVVVAAAGACASIAGLPIGGTPAFAGLAPLLILRVSVVGFSRIIDHLSGFFLLMILLLLAAIFLSLSIGAEAATEPDIWIAGAVLMAFPFKKGAAFIGTYLALFLVAGAVTGVIRLGPVPNGVLLTLAAGAVLAVSLRRAWAEAEKAAAAPQAQDGTAGSR